METLGMKNHNPLNVKNAPRNPWKGSIGTDEHGHAIFDDVRYSYRAGARIIQRKWAAGKRSLLDIFSSYAPVDDPNADNNPEEYAAFVAKRLGLLPAHIRRPLPELFTEHGMVGSWRMLALMLAAMAEFENYAGYSDPMRAVNSGIAMYEYDFAGS